MLFLFKTNLNLNNNLSLCGQWFDCRVFQIWIDNYIRFSTSPYFAWLFYLRLQSFGIHLILWFILMLIVRNVNELISFWKRNYLELFYYCKKPYTLVGEYLLLGSRLAIRFVDFQTNKLLWLGL